MLDVWLTEGAGLNASFIRSTMQRRTETLNTERWRREIEQKSVAEVYRAFKKDPGYESYLNNIPYRHRRHVARFRCRSNFLPIADFERHTDPGFVPWCPLCWAPDCNEPHLLFRCPSLAVERRLWQREEAIYDQDDDATRLQHAFQAPEGLVRLAAFIARIMEMFDRQ